MEERLKRKKIYALDNESKLLASNDLATYYYKHERYSDALREYELQANIYAELGPQIKWATCHRMIGEMYLLMDEFDKAIKFVNHHLSVAKELKNWPEEVMALETLGRIYHVQGESFSNKETKEKSITSFKAAEKEFMKGLTICETYHSKTTEGDLLDVQVRILLESGEVQEHLGFYDKGIDFLRKAISICLDEDFYDVLHKCYITKAYLHCHKMDYAAALSCSNRALEMSSRFKDKDQKTCEALTLKSDILCKMSDYQSAKQLLLKAWQLETPDTEKRKIIESNLNVVSAMCDTEDLVKSSNSTDHVIFKKLYEKLGDGAIRLKNYAGAVEFYLKMLDHAVRAGDSGKILSPMYFSLYKTYKDMGCYNEALIYGEKEYELWKNINPKYALLSLDNIADTLFDAKKPYHEVEKACIAARDLAEKMNKKLYVTRSLYRLLYYQQKYGETDKMESTKAEIQKADNMESDDEQCSDGESVTYEDSMRVEDDVPLEDLPGSSVTEKTRETKFTITMNSEKETALHRACLYGFKNKVESLLAKGHPVNIRDNNGWLPLHRACGIGRFEIVNMLINSGANVHASSYCNGLTPLHLAAGGGHLDVVQLLIEKGAIPSAKDALNETPLDALQGWRILQFRMTKKKKTYYQNICNQMQNFIKSTSGEVCYDVNVNDSFSNSDNFQNTESMLNTSTELNNGRIKNTGDIGFDTSKPKTHVKPVKDNISLPSTSKIIMKIPKSQINNKSISSHETESPDTQQSNHKTKISCTQEFRSSKSTLKNRNSSITSSNKYIPVLTPNEDCNTNTELNNRLTQNTGGIGFDTSKQKTHVKPIKDNISLPSTSKIIIKIPKSQINNKSISSDETESPDTQPSNHKTKISRTKEHRSAKSTSKNRNSSKISNKSIPVLTPNEEGNTSTELNNSLTQNTGGTSFDISKLKTHVVPVNDNISLPSTSKIIIKIPKSQMNNNHSISSADTKSLDAQASTHKTEISRIKEYRSAKTTSISKNSSKICSNKSIPVLTPNEEGNDKNNQNVKNIKICKPLTVEREPRPLDIDKNCVENIKKVTEPVVKNSISKKHKKSPIRPDESVNDTTSNSNNFQDDENVYSQVIAAQSILNTKRNLNDSVIRTNCEVDFNISNSKTPLETVKDMSRISTWKKIQDFYILDDSLDSDEFPTVDVKNSKHALSAPNKVVDDLSVNKQNDTERKGSPITVVKKRSLVNDMNKIENISKITEPLVESKKSAKRHKSRTSDEVDVNKNSTNNDNFQESINMRSEYMLNTSRVLNDSLIEYTSGSEFDTTEPHVKDISLSNTLEISNYFHESQSNISKTIIPPEDTQSPDPISTSDVNKSVPALSTSSVANNSSSIEIMNKISDTLLTCKINTKRKKSREIRDVVYVNKNCSKSENFQDNVNVYPDVIAAESTLNKNMEVNDNFSKNGVDTDTLKSKTRLKPINELSQPSTSKMSSNIQNKHQIDFSSDRTGSLGARTLNNETEISGVRKFPNGETNQFIPAFLTPSEMGNDEFNQDSMKSNKKKNNKRKLSNPSNVPAKKCKKSIKYMNKITKPQAKRKTNAKQKKSENSGDLFGNKNRPNFDNFQDNVRSKDIAAESMVYLNEQISDDLIENTSSVDLTSASNPILKIKLPSFTEISDYIQESESSKNQTATPEDTDSPNNEGVFDETKISSTKATGSTTSDSININASKFTQDYINKTSFTPNEEELKVNELKVDDTGINKQKKDMKNENRKLSNPLSVVAKNSLSNNQRDSIQNRNELIKPLTSEHRKSQLSDFVDVSENSIDAGNENMYPKIVSVKSLANYRDDNLSENECDEGSNAIDNINSNIYELVSVIKPVHIAQTSNMETQIIPPATVAVHIEEDLQLISLDLDTINMLTINWLVEKVKCIYHKLKGMCPAFNLMTSEGAILFEDEPLNVVLSSPELYTCLTNIKASPAEERYQENYNELEIHDATGQNSTDDKKNILPVDKSIQPTSLCPKQEISAQHIPTFLDCDSMPQFTSPQPEPPHLETLLPALSRPQDIESPKPSSPRPESPQPTSRQMHVESPQPILYAKSPRPRSLAQHTSKGYGFADPALSSKSMPRPSSPTDRQDLVTQLQSVRLDELELDGDTLQLLGVVPRTETRLGPPVHKVVARNWQEILANGLQKKATDEIMEVYSVPANCDLLLAPTLNPEVKGIIREDKANLDSSLMEKQKQLGLAISALGTAISSILLNKTSKQIILKPISDACRLLCDIHFHETETRRHNVITSTHPELQESLADTVRSDQLFGNNLI